MKKPTMWTLSKRFLTGVRLVSSIFIGIYWLNIQTFWRGQEWGAARSAAFYVEKARMFRIAASEMGGLLIKVGQILSTRVDLLPQAVIKELSLLQDDVQPVDFTDLQQVIEAEFQRPLAQIFDGIDPEPIASASLGQVHSARLITGETVAVKIMRPHIETLVAIDFRTLHQAMRLLKIFTDWYNRIDINRVYREIRQTIGRELDYINEGHNAERIAANLAAVADVQIPKIYWQYTTKRVLVMEYMTGIKITDYTELKKAGIDRPRIARKILEIYVQQIFYDGFFHADPHPGNLMVDRRGRLVLLDFGMTGDISAKNRKLLVDFAIAAVQQDYLQAAQYLKRLGFLLQWADIGAVADVLETVLEGLLGDAKESWTDTGLREYLEELKNMIYEHPFQFPADYAFLGRAMGTMYGLCLGLDPNFNFIEEVKPHMERFVNRDGGLVTKILDKSSLIVAALGELPPLAERVLRRAEQGALDIRLPMRRIDADFQLLVRAVQGLMWSVVIVGVLFSAVYLYVHGFGDEARLGLGIVFLLIGYRGLAGYLLARRLRNRNNL